LELYTYSFSFCFFKSSFFITVLTAENDICSMSYASMQFGF